MLTKCKRRLLSSFLFLKIIKNVILLIGVRMKRIIYFLLVCIFIALTILVLLLINKKNIDNSVYMEDLKNYTLEQIKEYCDNNKLVLNIETEYNDLIPKDKVISQSILKDTKIKENDILNITISKGIDYNKHSVNELGNIPVMMYHQIKDMKNIDTNYTGGNVDYDGYTRTSEAFRNDLEFYYNSGYRMIRLYDYVNGNIDVKLGYSPIVLTFDDGLNEVKVLGLDENDNLLIDPNCALGILEEYKKKYPDFNVTATFFINSTLFYNEKYNKKIINYLIDNGYDIGNHTLSHPNFNKISTEETQKEVGKMYQILDDIIPSKYVNIIALPYGNPSNTSDNFKYILNGKYNDISYNTISTLRVAWEADYSPFSLKFDKTYIKRIRAYDNNGTNFDIEYNFKVLENNRYISDGNTNTVVIKEKDINNAKTDLQVITY